MRTRPSTGKSAGKPHAYILSILLRAPQQAAVTAGLDDSSVPEPGISDSPPPPPGVVASTDSFPGTPLESNPASESSLPEPSNDIGNFVQATKSVAEICSTLDGLSNAKKYALMFRHVSPRLTLPRTIGSLVLVGLISILG